MDRRLLFVPIILMGTLLTYGIFANFASVLPAVSAEQEEVPIRVAKEGEAWSVTYEQMIALGFDNPTRQFRVTIWQKLASGFGGYPTGSWHYVSLWVDWNRDGYYTGAGEFIGVAAGHVHDWTVAMGWPGAAGIYHCVTITAPLMKPGLAIPGIYAVRAHMAWQAVPYPITYVPTWGNAIVRYIFIDPLV